MLDIVEIPLTEHKPENHQQENYRFDGQCRWRKVGTAKWSSLSKAVDTIKDEIWINGCSSTNGINDQIPEDEAKKLKNSLLLIRPDRLALHVVDEREKKTTSGILAQ